MYRILKFTKNFPIHYLNSPLQYFTENIKTSILQKRKLRPQNNRILSVATWIRLSKKMGLYWLTSTGWMDSNSHWALFPSLYLSVFLSFASCASDFTLSGDWNMALVILTTSRQERMGPLLSQPELKNFRERLYWPLLGCMPTLWTNSSGQYKTGIDTAS